MSGLWKILKLFVYIFAIVIGLFLATIFFVWLYKLLFVTEHNQRTYTNEMYTTDVRLQDIYKDQVYFKSNSKKDVNNNKIGEYGTVKDFQQLIDKHEFYKIYYKEFPQNELSNTKPNIIGVWCGYYFILYIPDNPALAEKHWCCYAFPSEYPRQGLNTFFINEDCIIWKSVKIGVYGLNLNKIPQVGDAYKKEPFTSEVDETRWKPVEGIKWIDEYRKTHSWSNDKDQNKPKDEEPH